MSVRIDHWRDELARKVSNWMLNHVATDDYRRKIQGLLAQGMFYARVDPFAEWRFIDEEERDVTNL